MTIESILPGVIAAAALVAAGCGGNAGGPGDGTGDQPADTSADDAQVDVPVETIPDTTPDAAPDAVTDADPDVPDSTADTMPDVPGDSSPGTLVGEVQVTYYWVAYEGDHPCASPGTVIGLCDGTPIATVCLEFAEAARLEGTARLSDGRMINIGGCSCSGGFDCFALIDVAEFPWGLGSHDNALVPFLSVATDTSEIPYGTVLWSPDVEGASLPAAMGGGTHDGCLRADDVGGGIVGLHVDVFAGLRDYYLVLDPQIPETVTLYRDPPRCAP